MYIETRGPTLEEVAKIIDGDEGKIVPGDIVHLHARADSHGLEKEHTVRYEDINPGRRT